MNLTITKEQILAGLQAVQNVVSTRTTLPILSNVLLRAEKDRVEFTATDLDVTVACSVEAKVKKAGAATVPVNWARLWAWTSVSRSFASVESSPG